VSRRRKQRARRGSIYPADPAADGPRSEAVVCSSSCPIAIPPYPSHPEVRRRCDVEFLRLPLNKRFSLTTLVQPPEAPGSGGLGADVHRPQHNADGSRLRFKIKHLRTRPYRPQTNGKAERFIRTRSPAGPTAPYTAQAKNAPPPLTAGSGTTASQTTLGPRPPSPDHQNQPARVLHLGGARPGNLVNGGRQTIQGGRRAQ
jgi:hypothetical protein